MKTILIVDPDKVSHAVGDLLSRSGFASMVTADAGTALARVRSGMPLDLIITEMLLPDMNGLDFLSVVRNTRPDLPVLVVTASGSLESYLHAIQLGAVDYVNKPIRAKDLRSIVDMVFDQRGYDRALPPDAA